MSGVLEGFLVIGVVVAVGVVVGRLDVLPDGATETLSRVAFFVASPALLFVTLLRADVARVLSTGLVVTALAAVAVCLLYVPVGLLRRRPRGETVVGSMASGYLNAGNLGIPIATYALGSAAEIAPSLIFQLAVLTPTYTTLLDVVAARRRGEEPGLADAVVAPLRNPLLLATVAGLVLNVAGVAVPEGLLEPVELLADLAVPAMLLAFGLSLAHAQRPGRDDDPVCLGAVIVLKNLVHPFLAWAIGSAFGLTGPALLAVVVSAALPTAQNVFGYAVRFATGVPLARDAALLTTLVSVPVLLVVAL
ncbi:AEC family transporter [Actinomycetospora lemnae]|uniref:AEC family transporter n=1 Tax=Actinomycetospora lemnae TaxID=3019891 RepID=A0ABT5SQ45_9PSEU|nr:AEC family transporter [Actinomycetospora sp. DW7H6]MDD7964961.1 AEC family transporter [Actinomycetospora sp. DW7H6]